LTRPSPVRQPCQRHEEELRDLGKLRHISSAEAAWYARTFEEFCDEDYRIRRGRMVAAASTILGLPCGLLAGPQNATRD